ncbi:hypothetical protein LCGC14_1618370 [marine sediment metagenome]|uniref:Uncharacterized protein n=1 Tax=marine sediment metagenome TaxID=412755 RepID=A0A0F9I686_9ZZZZ
MKLLGVTVGCPEALLHCEHGEDKRRELKVKTPVSGGCRRTYMKGVRECLVECCKCDWSAWVKDPTAYYGNWEAS